MKVNMPQKEGLYAAVDPLITNKLNDGLLTHMILFYRYTRIITGINDTDPKWHGSKWKCLTVNCLLLYFAQPFATSEKSFFT
jgi:hypothetical protein